MRVVAGFSGIGLAALLLGACTSVNPAPIADLTGTDWRVMSVNGRETPAQGDYTMRFGAGGAFGARLGCNLMGGEYKILGGTLTVSNLHQTLMGCPEPAMTFESQGSAILQQPMQVAFTSNERLSLSNSAGSITLDPVP